MLSGTQAREPSNPNSEPEVPILHSENEHYGISCSRILYILQIL